MTDDVELVVVDLKRFGIDAPVLGESHGDLADDGEHIGLVLLDIREEVRALYDIGKIGGSVFILIDQSLVEQEVCVFADDGVVGNGICAASRGLYRVKSTGVYVLLQIFGCAGKLLVKTLKEVIVYVLHELIISAEPDDIELILALFGILDLGHAELVELRLGHCLLGIGRCLGLLIFYTLGVVLVELGDNGNGIGVTLCSRKAQRLFQLVFCKLRLLLLVHTCLHNAFDGSIVLVKGGHMQLYLRFEFGFRYLVYSLFYKSYILGRHRLFAWYIPRKCDGFALIGVCDSRRTGGFFRIVAENRASRCRHAYQHKEAKQQTDKSFVHKCISSLEGARTERAHY